MEVIESPCFEDALHFVRKYTMKSIDNKSKFDFPVFDDFLGTLIELEDLKREVKQERAKARKEKRKMPTLLSYTRKLGRSDLFYLHRSTFCKFDL